MTYPTLRKLLDGSSVYAIWKERKKRNPKIQIPAINGAIVRELRALLRRHPSLIQVLKENL